MRTVRISDATDDRLDFALRHILAALEAQTAECSWMVSGVRADDAAFDATGEQAGRRDEVAASGERIQGDRLRDLADGTRQVIWGEFQAYADAGATAPVFILRAIDGSVYEVAAIDPHVQQNLEAIFRDVRSA